MSPKCFICILGLLWLTRAGAQNPASATTTNAPAGGTNAPAALVTPEGIDAEARELKAGDVLRFVIEQDYPRGNTAQQVYLTEAGEALFAVSRGSAITVKINARGKKLADVRQEVKALLDADYYQDCKLQVNLDLIRRESAQAGPDGNIPKVIVYGAMQNSIFLREGETKTLSDVILQVGQNQFANLKKVKIHRLDPNTKRETITEHNVKEILDKGDRTKDPVVQDGDRIEVPEKGFNF